MITPNEYTSKSIRGLNKAIRVGKTEVVQVIKVDS